jgi:hypothetical protein
MKFVNPRSVWILAVFFLTIFTVIGLFWTFVQDVLEILFWNFRVVMLLIFQGSLCHRSFATTRSYYHIL